MIPVVAGALKVVSKRLDAWLDKLGITIRMELLSESNLVRHSKDSKEAVGKLKERK